MKSTFHVWLLFGMVISRGDNTVIYKTVGDEVVLHPGPVTGTITVITWTCDKDIVAEWFRNNFTFYDPFTGRCELNTATGELTISNLTPEDSGSYTAEINNKVLNTTKFSVIFSIPTPTISTSCDNQMTLCVLTCEINTADAGPVTYYWWSGGVVMKSETKELFITKEVKETWFICMVENPVSFESSKEVLNPFTGNNNNGLYWLLILLVVGVVGVGVVIYKRKRKHSIVSFSPLYSCFTTKAGAAQPPVVGVINNEPETVNDLLIGVNNDTVILQQIDSAPLQQ